MTVAPWTILSSRAAIAKGRFPSVRRWNIGPAGRLGPVGPTMNAAMQIDEPALKIGLVFLPRHAIHGRGSLPPESVEGYLRGLDADMVQERGELHLLPLPCGLP